MYKTPDMTLAVALMQVGEELAAIVPIKGDEHGKVVFCFNQSDSLEESLEKYWRKEIKAPIQTVVHTTRTLKAKIKYVQRDSGSAE